ncbi:MAG: YggT family protein [Deltaproteobacteria bacterium]|nr:YggT family protein [Deltaproteobacteria bacterium]
MNALAYLLIAIAKILHLVINIYTFVVAFAVLLSWVNPDQQNPIVRMLRQLTDPVFYQVRRILPRIFFRSRIDFTPMIVLFVLIMLDTVAVQLLYDLAAGLMKGI